MPKKPTPKPHNPNPFDEATTKDLVETLRFAQIFSCLIGDCVKKGLFPSGDKVYAVQEKVEAVLKGKDVKDENYDLSYYETQMEGGEDK